MVRQILEEAGIAACYREYLTEPPHLEELQELWESLGSDSPALLLREKDALWQDLKLDQADSGNLLQALVDFPALLNRPVVSAQGRAIVARPPELVLDFLGSLAADPRHS